MPVTWELVVTNVSDESCDSRAGRDESRNHCPVRILRFVSAPLIALAVATPLLALPATTAHSSASTSEPTRIMIVGDSITHGRSGDVTWRYRLWKRLHQSSQSTVVDFVGPRSDLYNGPSQPTTHDYRLPHFDQDHASVWGASFSRYARDMGVASTLGMLQDYVPDVILLQLGVNDLTWGALSPASVGNSLRDFLATARIANPDVDVAIGELTPTWDPRIRAYNALLPDLVAELDTGSSHVVLARQREHVRDIDTYDGTHPSAAGETKIAGAHFRALRDLSVVTTATKRPRKSIRIGRSKVRTRVIGRRLVVRWSRAKNAKRYQVSYKRAGHRWKTRRQTRRKWAKRVAPGRHVVRVKGVRGSTAGKVVTKRVRVRR